MSDPARSIEVRRGRAVAAILSAAERDVFAHADEEAFARFRSLVLAEVGRLVADAVETVGVAASFDTLAAELASVALDVRAMRSRVERS